jgi:hypothetical protein
LNHDTSRIPASISAEVPGGSPRNAVLECRTVDSAPYLGELSTVKLLATGV